MKNEEILYMYIYFTTEEGDRVVENIGCVIIVVIIFFYQDIIEFHLVLFIHTSTRGILQRYIYIYMYVIQNTYLIIIPSIGC